MKSVARDLIEYWIQLVLKSRFRSTFLHFNTVKIAFFDCFYIRISLKNGQKHKSCFLTLRRMELRAKNWCVASLCHQESSLKRASKRYFIFFKLLFLGKIEKVKHLTAMLGIYRWFQKSIFRVYLPTLPFVIGCPFLCFVS